MMNPKVVLNVHRIRKLKRTPSPIMLILVIIAVTEIMWLPIHVVMCRWMICRSRRKGIFKFSFIIASCIEVDLYPSYKWFRTVISGLHVCQCYSTVSLGEYVRQWVCWHVLVLQRSLSWYSELHSKRVVPCDREFNMYSKGECSYRSV